MASDSHCSLLDGIKEFILLLLDDDAAYANAAHLVALLPHGIPPFRGFPVVLLYLDYLDVVILLHPGEAKP